MAKIVITLSAVLLAVVYHSYAAPSLTFGLNGVPLPSEDIPDISGKCMAEVQIATKTCNQTAVEVITKSGLKKDIMDAMTKGDQARLAKLQIKTQCCVGWIMLECMETGVKVSLNYKFH